MEQELIRAQNEGLDVMVKIAVPGAGDHIWHRLGQVQYDHTIGLLSGVIEEEPVARPYSIEKAFIMDAVVQEAEDGQQSTVAG